MLSPGVNSGSVAVRSLAPGELAALLRALQGKPARATVELRPRAMNHMGCFVASVWMKMDGKPPRRVIGGEIFNRKDECEAHAIRVANGAALTFSKCRDWDRYEFAVVTQGTRT